MAVEMNEELLDAVRAMIAAGEHYDFDGLAAAYAPDFQMLMVQPDGTVLQYGFEQHMKFLRDMCDSGMPAVQTPVRYCAAQVHDGTGYVVANRRLGAGAGEQEVSFDFMLRRDAGGKWRIFREHSFLGRPAA